MKQPHLQDVVDTDQNFSEFERLAHKILRSGFEGAQLEVGLRGDDENRKIPVGLDGFQLLQYLESVHARHLQVEQNERIAVLTMQPDHLTRMARGCNRRVARTAQHLVQEGDVGLFIVNDQDARLKNICHSNHTVLSPVDRGVLVLSAYSSAT